MSSIEWKFRLVLFAVCGVVGVTIVVWKTYEAKSEDTAFPELSMSEQIDDEISFVKPVRSVVRIRFKSGVKRTISFARNNSIHPADIYEFLQRNDQLYKPINNDTIRILRDGNTTIFVLGKEIP
ncbi:MAG TPA: hypothetical protein PK059_06750 [Cyclobacteriaceae bacterium]|nr:hypothetical protein [Cyclobacteriaceae bacterium]